MDAGLVVVLAAIGVFLLVPLVFAWVSTNPRRWARVERLLGRDPSGATPRWVWWLWGGLGGAYVVMGAAQLLGPGARWLGAMWILQGVSWWLLAGARYRHGRRRDQRTGSAQAQVEGRAEAGRPAAGG